MGIVLLLFCTTVAGARELWQAGQQYVRLEPREATSAGPHEHPVSLVQEELAILLRVLQAKQRGGFLRFVSKEPVPLLTSQAVDLLARQLASGLALASPEEELTFVVVGFYRSKLLAGDRRALGGRVFYRDGKLHMILGDVLRSLYYGPERDIRGFETEVDRRVYPLHAGSRDRKGSKDWELLLGEGMELHAERKDWVEFDLPAVMAALRQDQPLTAEDNATVQGMTEDTADLRREVRRQRVELARMRKRMGGSGDAVTVEERLRMLESLRDQGLVTEEEYQTKRKSILDSL